MKILISQTVEKEIFKIFRSERAQEIFLKKLEKINPEVIYLKRPFVKIKISFFSSNFRIIAKYSKNNDTLVLFFILKKTDKSFGENIFWNKDLHEIILLRNEKISNDIELGKFKIYF